MSEELLKELLEETKKQNKIQESIEREMKLQNDLILYEMTRDKTFYNTSCDERELDGVIKGKLYARLSDEDRSIIERYGSGIGRFSNEKKLYSITTEGFPIDYDESDIQDFISDMHMRIFRGIYTERELYEYFERVFERSERKPRPLDYFWEEEWEWQKSLGEDDDDEEWNEEQIEKYKQKFMEKYNNRISKEYAKKRKQMVK